LLFVDSHFLNADTCSRIRTAMDRGVAEAAEVLQGSAAVDRRARDATVIDVDPTTLTEVEAALDARRDAIAAFFGIALTEREGAGFLRYTTGGFYGPHRDWTGTSAWPAAARRRIALVVFLNSSRESPGQGEHAGGTLRIFDDEIRDVLPREGCLVAFEATLLHEVLPVRTGIRDVIVDWFY
jgi:predicted 2-oxoglutarate/Fe(II)-dependent dioxygenase YbiX